MIKFVRVNYNTVVQQDDELFGASRRPPHTRWFNTSFHPAEDYPDHPVPTESPYFFKLWLPLILWTRRLNHADVQCVRLHYRHVNLLHKVANASIPVGRVNLTYLEEIAEMIEPRFQKLLFPDSGLFMRLNPCSAKDGVQKVPGKLSLHSVDEIILRLVTSTRARNVWAEMRRTPHATISPEVYFLPFNERMVPECEYRVFCPPTSPGTPLNISAISQYQWHKPWLFRYLSEEDARRAAYEITIKCGSILIEINNAMNGLPGIVQLPGITPEIRHLLFTQGLTFDVFFDEETRECHLIELNVFGIRSACGSCLFHWKNDMEILYNTDASAEVEFRVTY
ncbi:hypothetical protein F4821DRAFT_282028 [Hypoxylon rubiginosum]|uniref:Uncharacterized protein n=1 Tax=Hypoxylon rubiginosum TaxID=110542 RepID=A0ACC0CP98_9PEZI|nr:hypothetical protein F4821DRAFT_282028 [Hypoxylon rubiginosum]